MSENAPIDEHVSRATEQLAPEFAGVVPRAELESIVRTARQDLEGQVVPTALDEMLHRLAHYRLSSRIASASSA